MPGQMVKLRPVSMQIIAREHTRELIMHTLGISNEVILVIACVFFFEFMPMRFYFAAIVMWIIGCLVGVSVSAYNMWEYKNARSRYKGAIRHEMLECCLYMFTHASFVVGSVLFVPGMYTTQQELMIGHATGVWCWIWGSLSLVIAGHWNSIGFIETAANLPQCERTTIVRRCASVALSCTAIGGAFFFAGSFLFRPGFKNECESPEAFVQAADDASSVVSNRALSHGRILDKIAKHIAVGDNALGHLVLPDRFRKSKVTGVLGIAGDIEITPLCVSIIEQGTLLFLLGTVAFLVHAILTMICTILLQRMRIQQAEGPLKEKSYGAVDTESVAATSARATTSCSDMPTRTMSCPSLEGEKHPEKNLASDES